MLFVIIWINLTTRFWPLHLNVFPWCKLQYNSTWNPEGNSMRASWLSSVTQLCPILCNPLDCSCLGEFWELAMDREAWCAVLHGVTKSQTWLSDWTDLKETEPISGIPIYPYLFIYPPTYLSIYLESGLYKLLPHVIQETEKSQLPAGDPGKPVVILRPERQRANSIDASLSQKAWELEMSASRGDWCPSSSIQAEREFDFL